MDLQLKGKKILFSTVPGDGHFNPLTGLAAYLKKSGCDVRWYVSSIFSSKLKNLDIPHYPFDKALDIYGQNLKEVFPEREKITDVMAKLEFDMTIVGDCAPQYLEDISTIYESFKFDIMISDCFFSAIPLVKHILKVPVIAIGVLPLCENSIDLAPYGMGLMLPKTKINARSMQI
ncbi:glycosyltransferase family protein [Pedobacter hartonius]|uniref:Glycosyltransferase, MGT family n=1 Tax=Pedobacter hartonius TaxID=425514 RepID=A0A1H4G7D7_9SPHI|nr:hypothetical protein [Pedobacter hartonius]SEB04592.1 hypothetical protein SAMN05443550_10936 [Pedobacter hartonius]